MANLVVTVSLNEEEVELLQERIDYLQAQRKDARVTKADALRHAIHQTNYKRKKSESGNGED